MKAYRNGSHHIQIFFKGLTSYPGEMCVRISSLHAHAQNATLISGFLLHLVCGQGTRVGGDQAYL